MQLGCPLRSVCLFSHENKESLFVVIFNRVSSCDITSDSIATKTVVTVLLPLESMWSPNRTKCQFLHYVALTVFNFLKAVKSTKWISFFPTVSLLHSQTLAHFLTTRRTASLQEYRRKAGHLASQGGWLILGPELVLTGPGGWKTWRGSWRGRSSCWTKREKPWGWKQRNTDRKSTEASINSTTDSQDWRKVGVNRYNRNKTGFVFQCL